MIFYLFSRKEAYLVRYGDERKTDRTWATLHPMKHGFMGTPTFGFGRQGDVS